MIVTVKDDFDADKIMRSGQCFRVVQTEYGYRFITGSHVLYMKPLTETKYDISCSRYQWNHTWKPYFDWNRNYKSIREALLESDPCLYKAASYSSGIRILRQDPWETLITFIISQRKSIPAIRSAVEALAKAAGKPVKTPYEIIYTFPMPKELSKLSLEELKSCSLGYRAPYIYDTVKAAVKTPGIMKKIGTLDDEDLLKALMDFPGVGIKVAGCTALFGYGRTSFAPVDVWISRVIDTFYQGENPFPPFGENAGILQQYLFFYAQTTKLK